MNIPSRGEIANATPNCHLREFEQATLCDYNDRCSLSGPAHNPPEPLQRLEPSVQQQAFQDEQLVLAIDRVASITNREGGMTTASPSTTETVRDVRVMVIDGAGRTEDDMLSLAFNSKGGTKEFRNTHP